MQAQEITVEVILCEYSRQLHTLQVCRAINIRARGQPFCYCEVLPCRGTDQGKPMAWLIILVFVEPKTATTIYMAIAPVMQLPCLLAAV